MNLPAASSPPPAPELLALALALARKAAREDDAAELREAFHRVFGATAETHDGTNGMQ